MQRYGGEVCAMAVFCLLFSFAGAAPDVCSVEPAFPARVARSFESLIDWRPPSLLPFAVLAPARPPAEESEDLPDWEI